ncbi:hypothetical protein [Natrialba sp. PRR66]|uniref:hypothetical protein n=1 Tax=Natrialba sp. PRR66 TaxID=3098146 RepID=UPI002B1D31B7|nr:hypothetical protein [Natrialba sp. PRR66]
MTEVYDLLTTGPQTQVDVSRLNFEERQDLCRIAVTRTSNVSNIGESSDFSTIYYLDGDERQAAAVFVDENRELLADVDFSKKNILQTSMPGSVYDWILHALGKRELEKYETVVLEERPDETRWVIDRQKYDESPNRRYTVREQHSARK